jgi:hypothetical protein
VHHRVLLLRAPIQAKGAKQKLLEISFCIKSECPLTIQT